MSASPLHAIVVGGSLAGLAATLALARVGVRVTVLERSGPQPRSGGAVGVDQDHLERITGIPAADPGRRGSAPESWSGLHQRLRRAAEASHLVRIVDHTTVTGIRQSEDHVTVFADGEQWHADVVVGADGHRSVVRRTVAPDHTEARFAGYGLWLGIAAESAVAGLRPWPADADILGADDAVLIGYPLEGEDGRRREGTRRLGWAWFDPTRNALLRDRGAVRDGVVRHSVRAEDVPSRTLDELGRSASQWPEPWRAAIRDSIRRRSVTGTPIAEYVPRRLVAGRVALVGNAAHVPTPMTGRGFDTSLDDAASLAEILDGAANDDVPRALEQYEFERLEPSRAMVRSGQSFSEWFGRS
ncbi:FAD-dependent monooxygenase [Agromyces sp. NPDC058484]|uniref:FAD-dependent monooxygenase n=1 Tax=Agromyces sp. NPDC058484 TaxID=3346524 RepID=UPI00365DFCC2